MKENNELINALDNTLHFLVDSKLCFEKHVENVDNQDLKTLFARIAASRSLMISDLKRILRTLNVTPTERGTLLGKAHMVFENIKSLLTKGDPLVITKEVRRGEGVLIEYYKTALSLRSPQDIKSILISHLNIIEDDIKQSDILSIS